MGRDSLVNLFHSIEMKKKNARTTSNLRELEDYEHFWGNSRGDHE